jgi:Protein of unknown function (DUF4239)
MLTIAQNIWILIAALGISVAFMVGLNRIWPVARRYTSNDQIGWQLSVLGTTYAVILGFMLYTEWTTFSNATVNASLEASALRSIYRLAEGLPAEQRSQLEQQVRAYADAVVNEDWPQMARGELPETSHLINEGMWKTLMSTKSATPSESIAEDHALSELSSLTQYRRTRLLQSVTRLPEIFWCVLFVGGVLTVASVSMFGSVSPRLHAIQVCSLTLLITLVMLAIADVDRPYQGWVHIGDYPFRRAQQNMQ